MFKGFFAGLAWGVALSFVMVVVANEMAKRTELGDVPLVPAVVEVPAGSGFDAVRSDLPPQAPAAPQGAPVAEGVTATELPALSPEASPGVPPGALAPRLPVAGAEPPQAVPLPGATPADPASLSQADRRPEQASAGALSAAPPDATPAAAAPAAPAAGVPNVAAEAQAPAAPDGQEAPAPLLLGGGGDAVIGQVPVREDALAPGAEASPAPPRPAPGAGAPSLPGAEDDASLSGALPGEAPAEPAAPLQADRLLRQAPAAALPTTPPDVAPSAVDAPSAQAAISPNIAAEATAPVTPDDPNALPPVVPGGGDSAPSGQVAARAPGASASPGALPAAPGARAPGQPQAGAVPRQASGYPGPTPTDLASLSQTDTRPDRAIAATLSAASRDAAPVAVAPVVAPVRAPNVTAQALAPAAPDRRDTAPQSLPGEGDTPQALSAAVGPVPDPPILGVRVAENGISRGPGQDQPPHPAFTVSRPTAPADVAVLPTPAAEGALALPPPGVPALRPELPRAPVTSGAPAVPGASDVPQRIELAADEAPAPLGDALTPAQVASQTIPTNRLPQTGVVEQRPEPDEAAAEITDSAVPEDALSRNAAPFEADAARPLLSIVLLDAGGAPVTLPFQASFALDPLRPDALRRAQRYRAAGHEVLALSRLPEGASATDAAQAIEGSRALLEQAVALIDGPEAALQVSRDALAQVVAEAAATGHGLLTFPHGLNSAQRVAQRQGVVTGVVFRDIDGDGQSAAAVKRFLDQAAFRARQEGAVIVFARVRPETLTGLAEWVLGNRAQSVTLAPVSVALKAGAGL